MNVMLIGSPEQFYYRHMTSRERYMPGLYFYLKKSLVLEQKVRSIPRR
jgi:hypothetical protein